MSKHIIKFYPVANGDTTFVKLSDNTTILIDCKIRANSEDENGNIIFDVHEDLIKEVSKKSSNPYLDLFILSHPDQDHCLGFDTKFYKGDPSKYAESNREANEILINEMWVTSTLFTDANCPDAEVFKKEAERRRKLSYDDSSEKNRDGNRIRMIGYHDNDRYNNVPNSIPGETLTLEDITGSQETFFEIFVHGPFKKSLIDAQAEKDKNAASIIVQLRFKASSDSASWNAYFLTGGDADHYRWKEVLGKSEKYANEDKLKWNLFQTPHHCSWTYFNDVPYATEGNQKPKDTSLKILEYARTGAFIVASSRKIIDEKPNPPHYAAQKEYLKKVAKDHFINTNTNVSEKKPQPITFEIDAKGLVRTDNGGKVAAAAAIAKTSASSGHWCA